MSAPTITSATFDKASYDPGDTMTATVVYADGASDATTEFDVLATNHVTGEAAKLALSFTIANDTPDPTDVTVSDANARVWTTVSDDGSTAVFSAVA